MKILCFLLSLLFSISLNAQDFSDRPVKLKKAIVLDKSQMECIYTYANMQSKNKLLVYDYILLIGTNTSKFSDYGVYRRDSVMRSQPNRTWLNKDFDKMAFEFMVKNPIYEIIHDRKANIFFTHDVIGIDYYEYADSVNFKWRIGKEKMEICGYKCTKATCDFRGRKWIAWFTNKISVTEGPWKFGGLPGLILRVEDDKKEHVYNALSVRKGGSKIFKRDRIYTKTTRKKFNVANRQYHDKPNEYWGESPLAPKDNKGKTQSQKLEKLDYNPIELE